MAKGYFPTLINQEEIRNKVDSLIGSLANHVAAWTPGRAANLDKLHVILNTPNGDTLAAWISAIDTKALNAYNKANEANQNAANAYSKANEALVAVQNATNSIAQIKNATDGHYICSGNARYTVLNREITYVSAENPGVGTYKALGSFTPKKDGIVRVHIRHRNILATGGGYRIGFAAMGNGTGIFDNYMVTGIGISAVTNKNAPGRDKSAPIGTMVQHPVGIYAMAEGTNHTNWIDAYADILVRKNVDIPFMLSVSTGNYGGAVNLIEIMYNEE